MHSIVAAAVVMIVAVSAADADGGNSKSSKTASADSTETAALKRIRAVEAARVSLTTRLMPTVVCIFPKGDRNGGGSGVLVSPDGYGLTNFHVVASLGAAREGDGGRSDGKTYPLEVLGIDPAGDIAMFKLTSETELPHAPLGETTTLQVGDWTLAMGNPFLLAEDFTPTVTSGIVSGLHRHVGEGRVLVYTDCIEINTSINPGNSGGPLFNMNGEVIGINGAIGIEERGRVNVGIGYAVTANQIRRLIPALRAGLVTRHATLGATTVTRGPGVVEVDRVLETSSIYKAGLRLRDRIVAFNGSPVTSANMLANLVGAYPEYWPVTLEVERDAKRIVIAARLDSLPLPPEVGNSAAGGPPGKEGPLTGPNVAANIVEVKRLLQNVCSLGGAAKELPSRVKIAITRSAAGRDAVKFEADESSDVMKRLDSDSAKMTPVELEQAVRWRVADGEDDVRRSTWQIIRSDEVSGRVGSVIEHETRDDRTIQITLDFETSDLLAMEFDDPISGKRVRYEYGHYRNIDDRRLPHSRRLLLDDVLYQTDRMESYVVTK